PLVCPAIPRAPRSTLFPYTTLFRSEEEGERHHRGGPRTAQRRDQPVQRVDEHRENDEAEEQLRRHHLEEDRAAFLDLRPLQLGARQERDEADRELTDGVQPYARLVGHRAEDVRPEDHAGDEVADDLRQSYRGRELADRVRREDQEPERQQRLAALPRHAEGENERHAAVEEGENEEPSHLTPPLRSAAARVRAGRSGAGVAATAPARNSPTGPSRSPSAAPKRLRP